MKICYLVERIGPYHAARLDRAANRGEVMAIELEPLSTFYPWDALKDTRGYGYLRDAVVNGTRGLSRILLEAQPDVVFINGWGDRGARAGLRWCVEHNVPAVLLSDSQQQDEARVFWKEWIKRCLLACCRAAFVAGQRHEAYLHALGFRGRRITMGYDVVDNSYFLGGAEIARANSASMRERLNLPERYFLCVSRFVPKKNILFLLRAFGHYRRKVGDRGWGLVLLGDGEMRPEIEAEIARAGLDGLVVTPGFQQYEILPAYYGLAGALVLASRSEQWGLAVNEAMAAGLPVLVSDRCGCVPELVSEGVNGWVFDPRDEAGLSDLLTRVADCRPDVLATMGARSRDSIAEWSLDRFADGLWRAAESARDHAAARPWTMLGRAWRRALLSLVAPVA